MNTSENRAPRRTLTVEELRALGASTDLRTAARALGLSDAWAYELAKRGEFPVPVIKVGPKRGRYVVPTGGLLAALGLHTPAGA